MLIFLAKLDEAIEICLKYSDKMPYIRKRGELMSCKLDIYNEMDNIPKCRELIAEIDRINADYKKQGVYIKVSEEIRLKIENGINQ